MQFFKIEGEITKLANIAEPKAGKPAPGGGEGTASMGDSVMEALQEQGLIPKGVYEARTKGMSNEDKRLLQTRLTLFQEKRGKDCVFYICSIQSDNIIMLGIYYGSVNMTIDTSGWRYIEKMLPLFLGEAGIECRGIKIEEITFRGAQALAELCSDNDFCRRSSEIFEELNLDAIINAGYTGTNIKFADEMLEAGVKKDKLFAKAKELLCCGTLIPELERIYLPAKKMAAGHPVHYLIQSDDDSVGDEITKILLSALYTSRRIQSRRFCVTDLRKVKHWRGNDNELYESLYESCKAGTVVVKMLAEIDEAEESDTMTSEAEKIEQSCRAALKRRNETLTIFRLPRAAERVKAIMREHLDTMTLVEITEDAVSHDIAKSYLQQKARSHKVRPDKALYKGLCDPLKTYSISELHQSFRSWYDNQLKTRCYTQYAAFDPACAVAAKKGGPRGDAYSELDKMIGLTGAKSVIRNAVDYFKAQKLFKERGIATGRPAMHMVFKGSPGTAKTSTARLFAQIMKDNGLLSIGGLVEVGRSDLVGRYVGSTAPLVVSKFKEATGSVLFIDEAYSLVDDRDGLFGDEAINTIVQQMENRRDDIVVIFAGYTDKMEAFLQKNPGLRSRIAFHVPFDDYSTDELLQILEHLAGKQSIKLDAGVREKLAPILEAAKSEPDFGNGRFMRNLLEKARMKQASRLLGMDTDKVTKDELMTLVADDFEPPLEQRKEVKQIGFCA